MSSPDFKDLLKELLDIKYKLRLLRRKQKLRNMLKILGIGFIIYKSVQNEIEESLSRSRILFGNLDASLSMYINSLRNGIENIRASNAYLTKDGEALWLNRIEQSKIEIAYLRSISILDNSQVVALLAELDGFQNFVGKYNAELRKKELRQELLLLKPEILQSEKEFNSMWFGQFYFSKKDLHNWKTCRKNRQD
jgi:hypothetical protein